MIVKIVIKIFVIDGFLPTQYKWTPIFAAAWRGHFGIVKYLILEQQCDQNVRNTVSKVHYLE